MTKKHAELVEELLKEECSTCKDHFEREDCLSRQENYCGVRMEKMLTLVLSAFHDGRLDEELEVVGHGKGYADTKGYDSGFAGQADVELEIDEHTVRRSQVYDGERLDFIALRKEGTGKGGGM